MASYTLPSTKAQPKTSTTTGPDISGRDWLNDWRETWNEATVCTLAAPLDDPDGGYARLLKRSLNAYTRLSERLSRGFDWLHDHDETHPSWAKNQALYDKLWWQREQAWQRAVAGSNNLAVAVWRLYVDWDHLNDEQRAIVHNECRVGEMDMFGFRKLGPGDIWARLMPDHEYTGEWPPNPSEGWWNVEPRGGGKNE